MTKQEEKLFIQALYNDFSLNVKASAKYILGSEKLAEKALVRTFLKVVKHKNLFMEFDSVERRRLMAVFSRAACFDILRRQKKVKYETDFTVPESELEGEKRKMADISQLLQKDKFQWFKDTFASFKSPFKEICIMKFYFKMPTTKVKDVLGLKASQVNSILGSRLAKLKSQTESYLGGEIEPAELGMALGLAGKKCADEDLSALENSDISRVSLSAETFAKVNGYLSFRQILPLFFGICGGIIALAILIFCLIIFL